MFSVVQIMECNLRLKLDAFCNNKTIKYCNHTNFLVVNWYLSFIHGDFLYYSPTGRVKTDQQAKFEQQTEMSTNDIILKERESN